MSLRAAKSKILEQRNWKENIVSPPQKIYVLTFNSIMYEKAESQ